MPAHTPLFSVCSSLPGVRFTDFGGWELPLHYERGILAEHTAVRNAAGLFDVSHMGQILIEGSGAFRFVDRLLPGKLAGKGTGFCVYSPMCNPDGGVIDDLLVYVLSPERFLLVVNAANTSCDYKWIASSCPLADIPEYSGLAVRNLSAGYVQIALQGPGSARILSAFLEKTAVNSSLARDTANLAFYRFATGSIAGLDAIVSRTGYTGEDGFEIYLDITHCPAGEETATGVWNSLLALVIASEGLPCGLGARDTLRLEAGLPLYGHELTPSITPLEAGLKGFLDLNKDFIGAGALRKQMESGILRTLQGLVMIEGGIPRSGCEVFFNGRSAGFVTSGSKSPTLDQFIGLALIEKKGITTDDYVEVSIHGKHKKARVVPTPFHTRRKK